MCCIQVFFFGNIIKGIKTVCIWADDDDLANVVVSSDSVIANFN